MKTLKQILEACTRKPSVDDSMERNYAMNMERRACLDDLKVRCSPATMLLVLEALEGAETFLGLPESQLELNVRNKVRSAIRALNNPTP